MDASTHFTAASMCFLWARSFGRNQISPICAQRSWDTPLMKAIHGGKAKNDQIDSQKIAALLRGGMLPQAYVYPAPMRATRDLLRRH